MLNNSASMCVCVCLYIYIYITKKKDKKDCQLNWLDQMKFSKEVESLR
jgi:type IV secretory pathway VirB3-like protein